MTQHAPRLGRNPKNGDSVLIPARQVLKFKPGKALRESVDQGLAQSKTKLHKVVPTPKRRAAEREAGLPMAQKHTWPRQKVTLKITRRSLISYEKTTTSTKKYSIRWISPSLMPA